MASSESGAKNVLINFRGGIGDFLILSPVLESIRRDGRYSLSFVGNRSVRLLAEGGGYFRHARFVDYESGALRRLIGLIGTFFWLRGLGADVCLTPVCSTGKASYRITEFSRADLRAGFEHEPTTGVYTHSIEVDPQQRDVDQNAKLLEVIGVEEAVGEPELAVPESSSAKVDGYLSTQGADPTAPIVAVAPFVKGMKGYSSRGWPLDRYIRLIDAILEERNVSVVLMGSRPELEKLHSLRELPSSERLLLQDSSFSIYDAAALLKRCSLLVCNDGGVMHMAAAVNTPIVSIWGPTSPAARGYLGRDNFIAIRKDNCDPCREYKRPMINCTDQKCLYEIGVEEVLAACRRSLDRDSASFTSGASPSRF